MAEPLQIGDVKVQSLRLVQSTGVTDFPAGQD